MKPELTHIDQIRTAFDKMQSREDLLHLLNDAKPLLYGEKFVPFELKQLTWYANPKLGRKRYTEFTIRKKSGADRSIHAPIRGLKSLQKVLSFVLQCVYEPNIAAMGFVRNKSIVDNAKLHLGKKYVYNIDLKDFFSSVDQARVWKCLQLKPFNLIDRDKTSISENPIIKTGIRKFITENGEDIFYKIDDNRITLVIDKKGNFKKYKKRLTSHIVKPMVKPLSLDLEKLKKQEEYNEQVNKIIFEDATKYILSSKSIKQIKKLVSSRQSIANIIASLCCTEMEVERINDAGYWEKVKRNVLPQGAPTSPVITNIVCQRLDYLLTGVAKRFGLIYSRYADDITFSSMHNVYQKESDFLKELHRIISEQGFHIKESKTRLQKDGYRKEVTGLLVNEKANVQQRYIKQLRMWLYYWEQYGYERAEGFFLQQYIADKGNIIKGKPDMVNVIGGKLDYLKMVKGGENELYLKLNFRFSLLVGATTKIQGKLKARSENYYFKTIKVNKETQVSPKPIDTVRFLKYFKFDSEYSFKDLVHIPVDKSHFDYLELLKNSNKQFLDIVHSENNTISLPKNLVEEVQKLFQFLSTNGLKYYTDTQNHPLEDKETGRVIQRFKGNYRFGNEKSESSIFSNLLKNIANKGEYIDHTTSEIFSFGEKANSSLFKIDQLIFYPDLLRFQSKANFFTWVPNVKFALYLIFDSILKHSNVNGSRNFNSLEKKIIVDINRRLEGDNIKIELSILDKNSVFIGNAYSVMNEMRRDFYPILAGISDFKVQFLTVENLSYECRVLPFAEKVEEMDYSPEGFKYIFTFYD